MTTDENSPEMPAATRRDAASADGPAKQDPRGNAVRHGLTAQKLLPPILLPGRLVEIKDSLRVQYQPTAAMEELLVCEAARHFAMMEVVEEAEPALLRQAAIALAPLVGQDGASIDSDLMLATAISTESLERVARYRRSHELAAYRALDYLRQIQAAQPVEPAGSTTRSAEFAAATPRPRISPAATAPIAAATAPSAPVSFDNFASEAGCEAYLRHRFETADRTCPRCHGAKGHWLASRKIWECAKCSAQATLRGGTVFARSPLPLTLWFTAIRVFLSNTHITARQLNKLTGIKRLATARAMIQRLQRALRGDDAIQQFAGLLTNKPQPGARPKAAKRSK